MATLNPTAGEGLEIEAEISPELAEILTPEALALVVGLERAFGERRRELLDLRDERQAEISAGKMPDFLPETAHVRESEWTVAPIPADYRAGGAKQFTVEIPAGGATDIKFDMVSGGGS